MIKNYFKIAWRNLVKSKGNSAINIGGLAVGMAVAILKYMRLKICFNYFVFATIPLLVHVTNFAQPLPDSIIKKIDNLFKKWDRPNIPGCAMGIVRNDSLIYAKGFGLANMEDSVPNTPESIFYMCSVSKQFTGYSIVLLARQRKLKLDDKIKKYLPWFPGVGSDITIQNLLNHTSGIRDDIYLAAISGLGIEGMLTQDIALNILKKQRSLNFKPGGEHSYSNSNYVLLAEIVKTVSGQSFRAFTDSAIFKPLNMRNSRFVDDYAEIIRNRAVSYKSDDGTHFKNSPQNVYTLGDGGLFTNVIDMSHWVMNFYNLKAGDAKDIQQLTEKGKLNNRKQISYAAGIAVDAFRGWKRYSHNGGLAGYCTIISVYPDLKTGFIVFGNQGNNDTYSKADQLADILITDTTHQTKNVTAKVKDSSDAVLKNENSVKNFVGDYIAETGLNFNFYTDKGKIWMRRNNLLIQESNDTFSLFSQPNIKIAFAINKISKDTSVDFVTPDQTIHLLKFIADTSHADKVLETYTGNYYCPELDCTYGIILKNHHLFLTNNKYSDAALTLMGKNDLQCDVWFMKHLRITRNAKNVITGFEVNDNSIRRLKFNKKP